MRTGCFSSNLKMCSGAPPGLRFPYGTSRKTKFQQARKGMSFLPFLAVVLFLLASSSVRVRSAPLAARVPHQQVLGHATLRQQVDVYIQQAENAQKAGEWEAALEHYRRALKIRPKYAFLYTKVGGVYYNQEKYEQAVENFRIALSLDHKDFLAAEFAGVASYRLSKFPQAITYLGKAISMRGQDGTAHYWLGMSWYALGKDQKAIAELSVAAQYRPKDVETLYWLGEICWKLSQKAWTQMEEADPDSVRFHQLTAEMYLAGKHPADAAEQYRIAIAKAPDFPGLREALGRTYLEMGKLKEATEQFRGELKINRRSVLSYYGLGEVFLKQGNLTAALENLQAAIRLNPKFAAAYLLSGKVYMAEEDYPSAIQSLQEAARFAPSDPAPHYLLSEAYRAMGETEKAKAATEIFNKLKTR